MPDYVPVSGADERRARRFNIEDPGNTRVQRRTLLAFLFGFGIFALVGSLSLYQATSARGSTAVIGAAVAATTEIDLLLDEGYAPLQELARQAEPGETIDIPAYPIDVPITREQVLEMNEDELRQYLLDHSSAQVYRHGLASFQDDGAQDISILSAAGVVEQLTGMYSDSVHSAAQLIAMVSFVITLIAGTGLAATSHGFDRIRTPGFVAAIAGLAGIVLVFIVRYLVSAIAGSDPLYEEFADLYGKSLDVPGRNFLVLLISGGVVWVIGVGGAILDHTVASRWERRETKPLVVSEKHIARYKPPRPLLDVEPGQAADDAGPDHSADDPTHQSDATSRPDPERDPA